MRMPKLLKIKAATFTSIIFLILVLPVSAFAVSQGNDEVYIASPVNNAVVTGVRQITYFLKEADKPNIPYQIDLFTGSCSANGGYFGSIANGTRNASSGGQTFTDSWDTDGPILNKSSIPDGNYCLRVCGTFRETPNNFYTLCDKKTVTIANTNQPPVINSQPPNTTVQVGGNFQYQVQASDPNGHALTYTIDKGGDFFLYMNRTTGLIYTEKNIAPAGNYEINITVSDGFGGTATQRFTLNVTAPEAPDPPVIEFTSPSGDVVITKDNTTVSWTVENAQPASVTLYYSMDGGDWVLLDQFASNPSSYDWDITGLESGEYRLRLVITDGQGNTYEKISEVFTVSNDGDIGAEEVPVIGIIAPGEDAEISEQSPVITVIIGAPDGTEVLLEDIEVSLDDELVSGCDFADGELSCETQQDLEDGRHKIVVSATDTNGGMTIKEWFFTVNTGQAPDSSPDSSPDMTPAPFPWENLSGDTLSLALLILCCGILLLVVPWLAFTLINRRRSESAYAPESYPAANDSYDYAPSAYNEPPPLVPNPDVPAYTDTTDYASPEPVGVQESFEPSIGTQTVGDDQFSAPEPVVADTGIASGDYASPEVEMPSIYSDDEEIPDWLKSTDDASSSTPVGPAGSDIGLTTDDVDNAKPYGSYGLASQNEEDSSR